MDVQVVTDLTWLTGHKAQRILLHCKDVPRKRTQVNKTQSACVSRFTVTYFREAATEIICQEAKGIIQVRQSLECKGLPTSTTGPSLQSNLSQSPGEMGHQSITCWSLLACTGLPRLKGSTCGRCPSPGQLGMTGGRDTGETVSRVPRKGLLFLLGMCEQTNVK